MLFHSSLADSDVELIDVGIGTGKKESGQQDSLPSQHSSAQTRSIVNSHQPIVHFEASVSVRARSPSYDYDADILPKELQTPKM